MSSNQALSQTTINAAGSITFGGSHTNPDPTKMPIGQIVFNPNTGLTSIVAPGPNGNVLTGLHGPQGPVGPVGPPGIAGMTGAMGMQGPMGMKGQTIFQGTKSQVSVDEIIDFMDVMKKRLLVLTPMFELHEKYPALKQAYEDYLLIEKLVSGDQPDEE
jgi:hypothetical protein